MKKILPIIGIVLLLAIVFLYHLVGLDVYLLNKMNNSKLPEEYKGYQYINTPRTMLFGNHEIKLMWESFEPIQHFISSEGDMIVVTSEIPKDRNPKEVQEDGSMGGTRFYQDFHFYKLDKNGEVKDHYVYKRTRGNWNELLFGDFIVNYEKKYYKTWIKDGDTIRKPMIVQNENLKWSREEQVNLYRKIAEGSDDYFRERKNGTERVTYNMDGKWYQLHTNTKLSNGTYYFRANPGYNNNLFGEGRFKNERFNPNRFPNIMPVYFQRKELVEFTSSTSGGSISSTSKRWDGDVYYQLWIKGDTLKFKKAISFDEGFTTEKFYEAKGKDIRKLKAELEEEYLPYLYFEDKNLNFQLFTISQHKLYIIKSIQ